MLLWLWLNSFKVVFLCCGWKGSSDGCSGKCPRCSGRVRKTMTTRCLLSHVNTCQVLSSSRSQKRSSSFSSTLLTIQTLNQLRAESEHLLSLTSNINITKTVILTLCKSKTHQLLCSCTYNYPKYPYCPSLPRRRAVLFFALFVDGVQTNTKAPHRPLLDERIQCCLRTTLDFKSFAAKLWIIKSN